MAKKNRIGKPKITGETEFTIKVNGKNCHVYLYPNGTIRYNEDDFISVKYSSSECVMCLLNEIEKAVLSSVSPTLFSKRMTERIDNNEKQ